MSKVELVRQALMELGEVSSQELVTFIEQRHGVHIETRLIPVLRASVLGQEMLERARQAARAATQTTEHPGSDSRKGGVVEAIAASPQEPVSAATVIVPSGETGSCKSG